MKTCIFAGTFDPITVGHEEVIKKCLDRYGRVLVVVGSNTEKNTFFSGKERTDLVKQAFIDENGVTVLNYLEIEDEYKEYLLESGARIYVRGIRNRKDVKFERKMKKRNKEIYPFIRTKFFKCSKKFRDVSSSMVRELILSGGDYIDLVPETVRPKIIKLIAKKTKKD